MSLDYKDVETPLPRGAAATTQRASGDLMLGGVGIVVDGRLIYTNPEATLLLRRPAKALRRSTDELLEELAHPEDKEFVLEFARQYRAGASAPNHLETRVLLDGETRRFEVQLSGLEYDGRPATLAHFRDVTRRVEHARRDQQHQDDLERLAELSLEIFEQPSDANLYALAAEMLRSLSGAAYVLTTSLTRDGGRLEVRHVAGLDSVRSEVVKILGADPVGMVFSIPDASMRRLAQRGMLRLISGGVHEMSYRQIPRDAAAALEAAMGITSVYGVGFARKGKLLGTADLMMTDGKRPRAPLVEAFGHQIAAALLRRQSELEQAELTEQLRLAQRLESVGRLAGGVAHEFNNLLTAISGNISVALNDVEASSPLRPLLEDISGAAKRGAKLTAQMLAFSRQQIFTPKVIDLSEVITSMRSLLAPDLGERIRLEVSCLAKPALVTADRGQVEQIVMNLAINARDAMPDGGTLRLQTSLHSDDEPLPAPTTQTPPPRNATAAEWVCLTAADTGHGMDADTQRRVFEPFFTTKPVSEGTGLGLSVVYGIVQQHGGYITVDSTPGEGSTFRVLFPAAAGEREPASTPPPVYKDRRGEGTILMVEDDILVRRVNERLLRSLGYEVLVAGDGQAGLEVSRRYAGRIDLLFTDVIMPKLNGFELAERVQQERPDIRVLFTSGYAEQDMAPDGLGLESIDLIDKPYTPEALAERVRALLDRC